MEQDLSQSSMGGVSEAVVDQLTRTKGWTRFFSVVLWIGAGFLVLAGIGMMVLGAVAGSFGEEMDWAMAGFAAVGGALVLGVIYLVCSVIYIYPALKLGRYSSRIRDLMESPSEANLVAALDQQRAFWKYMGVLMIICMALYPILIGVVVVVSVMTASTGGAAGG